MAVSGDALAAAFLQAWATKRLGRRKADGAFFLLTRDATGFALTALDGSAAPAAQKSDVTELKPNAGVRGLVSTALVQLPVSDPDAATRRAAPDSIAKDPAPESLAPLRAAIDGETDPALKAIKGRLERLLTLQFDPDPTARFAAIKGFGADLGRDVRGVLSQDRVWQ